MLSTSPLALYIYLILKHCRKDKTLVEILDRLKRLELKVDQIPRGSQSTASFNSPKPSIGSSHPTFANSESHSSQSTPSQQSAYGAAKINQPYRHTPAAHKILTWPAINQALLQSLPANIGDINDYERDGATFLTELSHNNPPLPLDDGLHKLPFLGMVCWTSITLLKHSSRTLHVFIIRLTFSHE
jgi:hypothetical protein